MSVIAVLLSACAPLDYYDFKSADPETTSMQPLIEDWTKKPNKDVAVVDGHVKMPAWNVPLSIRDWKGVTRSGHLFSYTGDNDDPPSRGSVHESFVSCSGSLIGDDGGPNPCEIFGPKKTYGLPDGAEWWIECRTTGQRVCWADSHPLGLDIVVDATSTKAVCLSDGWWSGPPASVQLDDHLWTITNAEFSDPRFESEPCLVGERLNEFLDAMHVGAKVRVVHLDPAYKYEREHNGVLDAVYGDAIRLAQYLAER